MEPNPIVIPIPLGSRGTISCVANATYYQQIALRGVEFYGGDAAPVFRGEGEDVPMETFDGGTEAIFKSVPGQSDLTAAFTFSTNGPEGPFQPATVSPPQPITTQPPYTAFSVSSEDGGGPDNNDSIMYVLYSPIEVSDQEIRDVLDSLINKK